MKRLWVLGVALLLGLTVWAAGDAALLPRDGFAAGWLRDGAPKVYESAALYDHIDGGGEAFLEMGFEARTVQRYRKGKEATVFEIYRMRDPDAALGVYLMNCGAETPDKSFSERHTVGRNQLLCVKGRTYLVATSPDASRGLSQVLVAAARVVTEKLTRTETGSCLDLLPKEGLAPRSERIIRGPIALQAIVTLGEGDVLQLKGEVTAVAADYKDKAAGPTTLIVAQYPSPEGAAAALKNLAAKLDPQFTAVRSNETELVFKDRGGKVGRASVDGQALKVQLGLASGSNGGGSQAPVPGLPGPVGRASA